MTPPTISYLSKIYFMNGAIGLLPDLLNDLTISRPLIVTDTGVLEAGHVDRLHLQRSMVFDRVLANPTEANANDAVNVFRGEKCDGIVALGGGSSIDCAKAVALLVTHPPPLEQYAFLDGGFDRIGPEQPPVVAIPTTAGTGAEVGRAALINLASGTKKALLSPHLIPNAVICDPQLTLSLPAVLTAATGMDAVAHCVESYCSPTLNPIADAIALDALARACEHIEAAVQQGSDLSARSEMMMAALAAGMTFQKGLGAVHSLSHALGTLQEKRPHHGTLNAVLLPHVLAFNQPSCTAKLQQLAKLTGADSVEQLPMFFAELTQRIGLPSQLRDLNLTTDETDSLAAAAFGDHCTQTNPHPLTVSDCKQLFRAAW